MEFEDRLQNHLANQAHNITVTREDPNTVANRSMARRRRTMSTAVAGFVVAACGFGWVAMNAGGPSATPTVVADDSAAQVEQLPDDGNGEGGVAQDLTQDTNAEAAVNPAISNPASTNVTVTGPLEAVSISSDNSPGSWFSQELSSEGVYYVLSSAPGEADPNSPSPWYAHPNTLYSFDESSGWSIAEAPDRFLSDLTVSEGILYALSTGSQSGDNTMAIGTSTDRGQTWAWVPANMDVPATATVAIEVVGERVFLHAQTLPGADWAQAIELLQGAGVDVDFNNLMDLSTEGFSYVPLDAQKVECDTLVEEWWMVGSEVHERFSSDYDAVFADEAVDGDYLQPTPAQMEELARLQAAVAAEIRSVQEARRAEFETRLLDAGCTNVIACDIAASDAVVPFLDEDLALGRAYNEYYAQFERDEFGSLPDEAFTSPEALELQEQSESVSFRRNAAVEKAVAAAGCESIEAMFSHDPTAMEVEPIRSTWGEVGISPPASWFGGRWMTVTTNGSTQTVVLPYSNDIVTQVTSSGESVLVTTMTEADYFGRNRPNVLGPWEPPSTEWSTSDGVNWSSRPSVGYGTNFEGSDVAIGDRVFRIRWNEAEWTEEMAHSNAGLAVPAPVPVVAPDGTIIEGAEPIPVAPPAGAGEPFEGAEPIPEPVLPPVPILGLLEVSIAGGEFVPVDLDALGVGSVENHMLGRIEATPIGIVVTMQQADSPSAAVLYSGDGVTWSRLDMNASWVRVMQGTDSIMLLGEQWNSDGPSEPEIVMIRGQN